MMQLLFSDKTVSYETFLNDLSARLAAKLGACAGEPEYVSQNEAFRRFGRANVERWRRSGKVQAFARPGKVEYRTAELRMMKETVQDYMDN